MVNETLICSVCSGVICGILGCVFFRGKREKELEKRIRQLEKENASLKDETRKDRVRSLEERERAVSEAEKKRLKELTSIYIPDEEEESEEDESEELDVDDDEVDEDEDLTIPGEEGIDIYPITEQEFIARVQINDSETLTYYQEDDVLTDSTGDKITLAGARSKLGDDILDTLSTTDEDVVYVENERLQTVFDVLVEHNQSFYRDVLGV